MEPQGTERKDDPSIREDESAVRSEHDQSAEAAHQTTRTPAAGVDHDDAGDVGDDAGAHADEGTGAPALADDDVAAWIAEQALDDQEDVPDATAWGAAQAAGEDDSDSEDEFAAAWLGDAPPPIDTWGPGQAKSQDSGQDWEPGSEPGGEPGDKNVGAQPDRTWAGGEAHDQAWSEDLERDDADEDGAAATADGDDEQAAEAEGLEGQTTPRADRLEGIVESLLFASDKPLNLKRLCELTGERKSERVRAAVDALIAHYRDRGIALYEVAGGWQFRTAAVNSQWVQQLVVGRPVRLSRAQLETLAIVAYRQPITRPEIDDIRGVDSGGTLKVLLDRNLIRVLGKKEEPGRPILYGTTKEFLEFFNLGDLRELPTLREYHELTEDSMRVVERMGVTLDQLPGKGTIAPDSEAEAQAAVASDLDSSAPEPDEASANEDGAALGAVAAAASKASEAAVEPPASEDLAAELPASPAQDPLEAEVDAELSASEDMAGELPSVPAHDPLADEPAAVAEPGQAVAEDLAGDVVDEVANNVVADVVAHVAESLAPGAMDDDAAAQPAEEQPSAPAEDALVLEPATEPEADVVAEAEAALEPAAAPEADAVAEEPFEQVPSALVEDALAAAVEAEAVAEAEAALEPEAETAAETDAAAEEQPPAPDPLAELPSESPVDPLDSEEPLAGEAQPASVAADEPQHDSNDDVPEDVATAAAELPASPPAEDVMTSEPAGEPARAPADAGSEEEA